MNTLYNDLHNAMAEAHFAKIQVEEAKDALFAYEWEKFLDDKEYRSFVWRHSVDKNNGRDVDIWDNDDETLAFYLVVYILDIHRINLGEAKKRYFEK